MKPRDYQQDCIDKALAGLRKHNRILGVLATGGGKTIVFCLLAEMARGRTLIVAHRDELIEQAREKLKRATGIIAGVHQGKIRAASTDRVVVASIQSLTRSYKEIPPDWFSLGIVDECHHRMAPTYIKPLDYFAAGGMKELGVTATPNTKGKRALGKVYEHIAFEHGLIDLMERGWLSAIKVKPFKLKAELPEQVRGKWKDEEVAVALDPFLANAASRLPVEIGDRKTIIFVPLVKTAKRMVELLKANQITAAAVWGDDDQRAAKLADHGTAHQVIVNSALLTEGYDDPEVSCIMILRPMQSADAVAQMIGRGTRLYCPWGCHLKGLPVCEHGARKKDMLWLDPLWLHETNSLVKPAHLMTNDAELQAEIAKRLAKFEELDFLELLDMAQQAVDHQREASLAKKLAAKIRRSEGRVINYQDWAQTLRIPEVALYQPSEGWHALPPTAAQCETLRRFGFNPLEIKDRGRASVILNAAMMRAKQKLAPVGMVRALKDRGVLSPEKLTLIEARELLDSHIPSPNHEEFSEV